MTEAVAKIAAAAGARCYTDPFVANPTEDDPGLIARVVGWFDAAPRKTQRELHAA
jgi:3-phenylpropionate/trans-cinnamate dioxygenase ferredoxin reductase subunit